MDKLFQKEDISYSEGQILILSAAVGAGHLRAADALVSAFKEKNISARHVEVLKYTNPIFRKFYSDLYTELVNHKPDLLGWLYNELDKPWQHQKRRMALNRLNIGPFIKFLLKSKPDFVICTHFLPAEILMYLKRKKKLDVPVAVVITDLDAHALWIYHEVDFYFVACEETKVYLSELGIAPEKIFITGIPIDPVFTKEKSQRETRIKFGLDPDRVTLLVSLGGFGVGPVEVLVKIIDKVKQPAQIVVVCGRNESLKKKLSDLSGTNHTFKIIGFTNEMDSLMAASDILIGKAGGLTCSEALARGLIMVIVNPTPGQEERNSDHLLEEGASIRCNNFPALAYKIDKLLEDKERMRKMKEAIKRLAHPDSASKIVSVITGLKN